MGAWPEADEVETDCLGLMRQVREIVSEGLEARAKAGIKVRQPLSELKIKTDGDNLTEEYLALIEAELNVKKVAIETTSDQSVDAEKDKSATIKVELDTTITPELKAEGEGREFIRAVQVRRKEAGLLATDRITLTVETSTEGKELLSAHQTEIKKTTKHLSLIHI